MIELFRIQGLLQILVILLLCQKEGSAPTTRDIENTFSNPLMKSGADPWVVQRNGWYYFTHTTGKDLRLYRTKRMSELKNAEVKTVWTPPATGMNSKQIWAPEIHFLYGKWYFYYAADDGDNANHRMWVLEHDGEDPFTGEWVDKGRLELPDDKWAIDGTPFEHDGELYFVWSGWEGSVNVSQNIYIAKMDDPLTPVGDRTLLSKPDFSWEKQGTPMVNEAPQFLRRDDRLFIVYSASGCWTDDYALGLLHTSADANPMDASSWRKHPEPIFEKDPSAQAYGPGHNSFFTSPDGSEDWMIYHANPKAGQGCGGNRSPRMQRIGWTAEGFPELGRPAALGAELELPSGEK